MVFKNTDMVPITIGTPRDVEGAMTTWPIGTTFDWVIQSTSPSGLSIGYLDVAPDGKSAMLMMGEAGATGFIILVATLPDGNNIIAQSEDIVAIASAPIETSLVFGASQPKPI